jgi:hypothetical protein
MKNMKGYVSRRSFVTAVAQTSLVIAVLAVAVVVTPVVSRDLHEADGKGPPRAPEGEDASGETVVHGSPFEEAKRIVLHGTTFTCIATGPYGALFAAGAHELLIFDEDYRLKKRVKLEGEATSIASDEHGALFVGMTDHVAVYDREGTLQDIWVSLGGNAVITSVAVSDETVYLADAGNRLVMGFTKTGRLETIIGKRDGRNGAQGFVIPSPYFDVAVGSDLSIWAADTGRKQLENYTTEGEFLSAWGASSNGVEGFCGCCNPSHFSILPDGFFVTSEKGIPRVKLYDPQGNFVEQIAGPERFEPGTVGLDIAVRGKDTILVLYPQKGIVLVYERKGLPRE